jgi:MFS family permease
MSTTVETPLAVSSPPVVTLAPPAGSVPTLFPLDITTPVEDRADGLFVYRRQGATVDAGEPVQLVPDGVPELGREPEPQPEPQPVTVARRPGYRDVLRVREYRALFLAEVWSFAGDQVAAVALAVLLYQRSGSPFLAALGYASAFLPWAIGGPLLAVLADRFPTRRVVVSCDVARALLIGAAALPGMPLPAIGGLVLVSAFLASPFESASSAVLPLVLEDSERYSVATSIRSMTNQGVSLIGFAVGGLVVAAVTARGALAFDAVTFAVSAVLLRRGLQDRPAAMADRPRASMVADSLEGLRVVAADPRRYGPLLVAVVGVAFMVVPEAIATALAHSRGYGAVAVGLIMGAYAAGSVIGGFVLVQVTSVETRRRWMWRMAVLGAVPMVPVLLHPGLVLLLGLLVLVGVCASFQLAARTAFAAAVPAEVRGRAYGIAFTGMYTVQGVAILVAGAVAQILSPDTVVAGAALVGAACLLCLGRAADWRLTAGGRPRHRQA